jgi:hypothetical protein
MFYLLKHLLLLILVIIKLKCNILFFSEIMILNASYVYLHAFSLRRESPDLDPWRRTPHFWGGSFTTGIKAISGLNTHSKHLKISTIFTVRMLSPYKDYSSLLWWQANMCSYIASTKVCCGFWECLPYFLVDEFILLFVALVELLGLWMLLYSLWRFLLFVSSW